MSRSLKTEPRSWPLKVPYPAASIAVAIIIFVGLQVLRRTLHSTLLVDAYVVLAVAIGFGVLGHLLGRKEDALWETSRIDPLTSIGNRRSFDDRLARELVRATETGMPLSLLAIDLDHLKLLNDRHGHIAGDRALRVLADVLRSTCRSRDLPARFGGDEFVVVMPRSTAKEAAVLGERIRAQFRESADEALSPDVAGCVSVSVGAADLAQIAGSTEHDALFRAADRALYAAKAGGRDQVVSLDPSETARRGTFPMQCVLPPGLAETSCAVTPIAGLCTVDVNVRSGFARSNLLDRGGARDDLALWALCAWDRSAANG